MQTIANLVINFTANAMKSYRIFVVRNETSTPSHDADSSIQNTLNFSAILYHGFCFLSFPKLFIKLVLFQQNGR